jgi:hypothetical protein
MVLPGRVCQARWSVARQPREKGRKLREHRFAVQGLAEGQRTVRRPKHGAVTAENAIEEGLLKGGE